LCHGGVAWQATYTIESIVTRIAASKLFDDLLLFLLVEQLALVLVLFARTLAK
jgi:hypothetical protein